MSLYGWTISSNLCSICMAYVSQMASPYAVCSIAMSASSSLLLYVFSSILFVVDICENDLELHVWD